MTGAWKGGLQWGRPVTYGTANATASATTFTKGAWAQVTAASPTDSTWMQVMIRTAATGGSSEVAVDIATGASGSENVVVANLISSAVYLRNPNYMFPLNIGAGTRIAVRNSTSVASEITTIQLTTFDDTYHSTGAQSAIDTYGFNTANNLGTLVDPGATANTKSAYVQITASTTNDLAGFFMGFDNQTDASGSVGALWWLVDIAVGASGSEQIMLPNYSLYGWSVSGIALVDNIASPFFPIPIQAGSRVAVRAQCATATSPDRKMGFTLYGVRG